jgi:NAD+ synthase
MSEYKFNVEKETANAIAWIKDWFENKSGGAKGIIVGISGGKDSTTVAKLCCEAIGKENVFGVMMPNGIQKDIAYSQEVCKLLGIRNMTVNIKDAFEGIIGENNRSESRIDCSEQQITLAMKNVSPRLRMTTLYFIGQCMGYRVAGTGNMSEAYVGYFTKWGDGAHDFNVLANFTKTEVVAIAEYLGIPEHLARKTPTDGLSDSTDEQAFGFTYEQLDKFVRGQEIPSDDIVQQIVKMRCYGDHKLVPIPQYMPNMFE